MWKKKSLWSMLLVLMLSLVVLVGCSTPASTSVPASAATTAPASASAQSASVQVIQLIANVSTAEEQTPGASAKEWAQKLEELSNGRVKVVMYYSSGLFPQKEVIRSVLAGTGDISFDYTPIEDPGLMVLNSWFDVPFMGITNTDQGNKILKGLYEQVPELTNEFQGLKIICPTLYSTTSIIMTTKKPIKTSADLKGMKFISQGYGALWFQAMGAVPVNLSWPDFYTSMEKGVVDGSIMSFGPAIGSGMIDLFRYYTMMSGCWRPGVATSVMNINSFNKLPADIQKIITDLDSWYMERRIALDAEFDNMGMGMAKEKGGTFIDLSPEVYDEWAQAAKPVHEQWIKEAEGKGKNAQEFYKTLMQLVEQYK